MTTQLIVLDRDGVINQDSPDYVKSTDEWIPIEGSLQAIADLSQAGFTLAIATNQSGIGRGYYDEATLAAMHQKMQDLLQPLGGLVSHIAYCPHAPEVGCDCRKPLPGLLHQIAQVTDLPLAGAYMVGDSWRDLQAGMAVGMRPVLVLTGNGAKTRQRADFLDSIPVFEDLAAFARHCLAENRE